MKKGIIAILTIATLSLTGCYQEGSKGESGEEMIGWNTSVQTYELPDGRTILCLRSSYGSMDCDWESAK